MRLIKLNQSELEFGAKRRHKKKQTNNNLLDEGKDMWMKQTDYSYGSEQSLRVAIHKSHPRFTQQEMT